MSAMRTMLPRAFRLREDLTSVQRVIAVTLIMFGAASLALNVITIFILADLGRPSLIPWIALLLFGFGPLVTAVEEYGVEGIEEEETPAMQDEGAVPVTELHGRPTPPRLHLVRSASHDTPPEGSHDHVRTAG